MPAPAAAPHQNGDRVRVPETNPQVAEIAAALRMAREARAAVDAIPARYAGGLMGLARLARLAALELDLRVSALTDLGRSSDDGRRFALERAARDLLVAMRG